MVGVLLKFPESNMPPRPFWNLVGHTMRKRTYERHSAVDGAFSQHGRTDIRSPVSTRSLCHYTLTKIGHGPACRKDRFHWRNKSYRKAISCDTCLQHVPVITSLLARSPWYHTFGPRALWISLAMLTCSKQIRSRCRHRQVHSGPKLFASPTCKISVGV